MRVLLSALLLLALPGLLEAQTVTFSDGTFADADWSSAKIADTTAGSAATFTAGQIATGGNPDAYRQTFHSYCTGYMAVAHVRIGAVYDPGVNGPITGIDASYDLRHFLPPSGQAVSYKVLLLQDGNYYGSLPGSPTFLDSWLPFTETGLLASDFHLVSGSGPATPNFGASGAPITVGYVTSNTSTGGCLTRTSGIDNWSVTVHSLTPVPALPAWAGAALALVLVAAGAFWIRRRRSLEPAV
jgi:hypothetical protein